jgi:hypothetical protein
MPNTDCRRREYNWDQLKAKRSYDYIYAGERIRKRHHDHLRGYEIAGHFADALLSRRNKPRASALTVLFRREVECWRRETGHLSSSTRAMAHPSYQRIIGLSRQSSGFELERLLLNELREEPDHWFQALSAITGENPVKADDNFDASVVAWLDWGRAKGII